MHPVLVFSVPGTGTRFTITLLQDVLGYRMIQTSRIGKMESDHFVHIHSWAADEGKHAKDMKHLRAVKNCQEREGMKTVIPLRSPIASYLTRRHVTAGETQEEKDATARSRALGYWQTMRDCMGWFDYVLFPVEDERVPRHTRVQRVVDHVGVDCDVWSELVVHDGTPRSPMGCFVESWAKVGTTGPKSAEGVDVEFLRPLEAWYRELLEGYVVQ